MRWLLLKPTTAYTILLLLLGVGLVFAAYKLPFDPDLFWHIRAGQDITRIGIPFVDWYSHTMPNFFWINHEYAQDVVMAWVHELAGFRGLSVLYTLLIAASLSVGVWWSMARRLPWTWSFVAGTVIALASRSFIGTRPQMFTYALLLALIGVVRRALRSNKLGWFVLVPVIFAVWANVHASFIAGFVVLLIVITTESCKLLLQPYYQLGAVTKIRSLGWLAVSTIVSIPATFANPYGYNIWLEPYRTLSDKNLHENIVEWFGPQPYTLSGWVLFGVLVAFAALLVVRQKRTDLTDGALVLAFFTASLLAVRNIPLFLLFAVPLGLEMIRALRPKGAEIAVLLWPTLLAVALFVVAGASKFPFETFAKLDRDQQVFTQDSYPVGAAQFLLEHDEFSQAKPYNEYGWGGYLLFRVPWFKTFIDGRMPSWEQDGVKIIDKYFTIDRRDDWQKVADEYSLDLFIIRTSNKLVGELEHDNRFTEAYRDDIAVIFAKKTLLK